MAQRLTLATAVLSCLAGFATSTSGAAGHDSGRIAFTTDRAPNLRRVAEYSVSEKGADKRQIAMWPRGLRYFVPSPDRKQIVFVKYESGSSALFVASRTGADPRQLTPPDVHPAGSPTFSPSGRRVAFETNLGIYVVGIDGRGLRRVGGLGRNPTWSSDGRRIAYAGDLRNGVGFSIFVVVVRTGRSQRIGLGDRPAWAPDGGRIAYRRSDGQSSFCVVRLRPRLRHCVYGPHLRGLMWSPTGRHIALFGGRGLADRDRLAVVRPDGTGLRVVTRHLAGGAGWSPDGRRLAYLGLAGSEYRIYVRNALGPGAARAVARESPHASIGCCAFRGRRIAYTLYLSDNDYELAVMNADGSGFEPLTSNNQDDLNPAWSPNGATIAYSRQTIDYVHGEPAVTSTVLRLVGGDGSNERPLTENGPWQDLTPTWSLDGRSIAFVRMSHGDGTLMVIGVDGSDLRSVATPASVSSNGIAWSPDGEWIAFTFGNTSDLELIRPDGTGYHEVVASQIPSSLAWAPDGSRIAFTCMDGLFTQRPDGSLPVRVTGNVLAGTTWSPDSQRLAFSRTSPADHAESDIWATPAAGGVEVQLTHDPSANLTPAWSP
jgi:TolB protein